MNNKFDILIKKGVIVDGTGENMYTADLAIRNGKIAKIGDISENEAEKVIYAEGMVLTPGFIDVHSHADSTLLLFPKAESCTMQGVTTVVGGNCGFSPAPIKNKYLMEFWEFDLWDEIEPSFFGENPIQPIEKVKPVFEKRLGLNIDWNTFKEFLDRVEEKGISVNFVPLVGHCQVRTEVMEDDFARLPNEKEMDEMKEMVKEAMEAGAFGFSSGLSYVPGVFSSKDELAELAEVVKKYDGLYATHFNRVDLKAKKGTKIKGIEEAIEIAKKTGIKVQISHIYNGYDIYPSPSTSMITATAKETLEVLDKATEDGVGIAFDIIPNIDGGIALMPNLITLVYGWFKQSGTIDQFLSNLKAKDYRESIKETIESGKWHMLNPVNDKNWDENITVIKCKAAEYVGKTLRFISQEKKIHPLDLIFDLLTIDYETKVRHRIEGLFEEAIGVFLDHPKAMVGSDTFAFDDKSIMGLKEPSFVLPHPNTYSAFPKYLKDYKQTRLEETIRKITGFPAEWFGIKDRGLIKEGFNADIVLMNLDQLNPNQDYIEPRRYPDGIKYVIVNGQVVIDEGKHTGTLAGKVLRKNK